MLTEQQAREMTAGWISPADPELTRFATGHDRNPGSVVDWEEFIAELDQCTRYATDEIAEKELDALGEFARARYLASLLD